MLKKWIMKIERQNEVTRRLEDRKKEHEQFLQERARLRKHEIENTDLGHGENNSTERRFFRAKYSGNRSKISVRYFTQEGNELVEHRFGRDIRKGEEKDLPDFLYLYLEGKHFYEFFSGKLIGELTKTYVTKNNVSNTIPWGANLYTEGDNTYRDVNTGKICENVSSWELLRKGCICRRKWKLFDFGEYLGSAPSEDLSDYRDWDIKELTTTGFSEEVSKYMCDKDYIVKEMHRYICAMDECIARKEAELASEEVSRNEKVSWLNDYIDQRK